MRLAVYYFGCDFFYCCLHLYCVTLKHNVSATVSSGFLQVFIVYLGIEMIQTWQLTTIKLRTAIRKITTKIMNVLCWFFIWWVGVYSHIEMQVTGKEEAFRHFFLHMRLKFDIIWAGIDRIIELWNNIDISEIPSRSQMISLFFLWNTLYLSKFQALVSFQLSFFTSCLSNFLSFFHFFLLSFSFPSFSFHLSFLLSFASFSSSFFLLFPLLSLILPLFLSFFSPFFPSLSLSIYLLFFSLFLLPFFL